MTSHTETKLVHTGKNNGDSTGAISAPVYLSTAYQHSGIGESTGFDYSRTGNPTRTILERSVAEIEYGEAGFAFSSGMAAIQTALSLFGHRDEVLVSEDLYGGSYRLFEHLSSQYGLQFQYCDSQNLSNIEQYITEKTKAVYIETPTNPLMHVADISEIAKITKKYKLLLLVDNTLYTPLLQQPLLEGADIVIHSATKYLGGHNDVLAGILVAKGPDICEKLATYQNTIGAVLSPFDSWLLMRGMKTLPLRMNQHERNAKEVVSFLENHQTVTHVFYPGLGGMVSFRLETEDCIDPFLRNLKVITFAESLGGVESFITYPATQTHADIPEETRKRYGVCNRLLRFSVGIEHIDDLLEDLDKALTSLRGKQSTRT
ncbi:methionine biosynthesis PLP-dependent protein [Halobacillus amylolyticus]|uniref:Methionine biosynthesis PLP-dependent protein n=1 Tax=Halobacillus amylolyticus TaxID=2932259 RepID=A0ABY4HBC0_9BACI|nr:methionine biosynthesis PLP-dependent protein [Halobacillus amylolyticus]UOR12127.1 methionine biosynthesis PLP-dependent protein [Halobacillus amylolyticus]